MGLEKNIKKVTKEILSPPFNLYNPHSEELYTESTLIKLYIILINILYLPLTSGTKLTAPKETCS